MYKLAFIACLSFYLHCFVGLAASTPTTPVKDLQTFFNLPGIYCDIQEELLQAPKGVRFVFVRHGETLSNVQHVTAGRTVDAELTRKGIEQAKNIAGQLREVPFEEIYSSPLTRTMQTAAQLSEPNSGSIIKDERLLERHFGSFEGTLEGSWAKARAAIEQELIRLPTFEEKFSYKLEPQIESYREIHERFTDFMNEVALSSDPGNYLAVTHAGTLKVFLIVESARLGFDLSYLDFNVDNCALLVVEVEGPGQYKITASQNVSFK